MIQTPTPMNAIDLDLISNRELGSIIFSYLCINCRKVPLNPLKCCNPICALYFCDGCFKVYYDCCPGCHSKNSIKPISNDLKQHLSKIKFECLFKNKGCNFLISLHDYQDHLNSKCRFSIENQNIKRNIQLNIINICVNKSIKFPIEIIKKLLLFIFFLFLSFFISQKVVNEENSEKQLNKNAENPEKQLNKNAENPEKQLNKNTENPDKQLNKKAENPDLVIKKAEIQEVRGELVELDSSEDDEILNTKIDPILTFNQIYDSYTKEELQDILQKNGLSKSGNKDELICRLRKSIICKKWTDKKLKKLSITQMLDLFSKDDLQLILENKNLPISGNKEELITKIRNSLKKKNDEKKGKKFRISNLKLKKLFEKNQIIELTVDELLEINRERGLNLPRNKIELLKILFIYLKNN